MTEKNEHLLLTDNCYMSEDMTDCNACNHCKSLTNCTNCTFSHSLSNEEYMVFNKKVDKLDYPSRLYYLANILSPENLPQGTTLKQAYGLLTQEQLKQILAIPGADKGCIEYITGRKIDL